MLLPPFWCTCTAINNPINVQYDGGFLLDIMLLSRCYYHIIGEPQLNLMKRFPPCSQCSHLDVLTFPPHHWVDALRVQLAFTFFLKVCVLCVVITFILNVRFVDVPVGVTQEEDHTGFLHHPPAVLALIFFSRKIQPLLSLDDLEVEFCSQLIVDQLLGIFIYLFILFLVRKNPGLSSLIFPP